eukprot:scaffold21530_cov37-Tisochrysis_lutea.AAC.5
MKHEAPEQVIGAALPPTSRPELFTVWPHREENAKQDPKPHHASCIIGDCDECDRVNLGKNT